MANGDVLELSSLPARHPRIGTALLQQHACLVIVRLRDDPTRQPSGTIRRAIEVQWRRRPGTGRITSLAREVGWAGLESLGPACEQLPYTRNDEYITEAAAIGVAALLIHELEEGKLRTVLPIGSGGDYLVQLEGASRAFQIEMSGVREDAKGSATQARLRIRAEQVLSQARAGFVSVTTFAHGEGAAVRSCLQFVRKGKKKPAKRKKK